MKKFITRLIVCCAALSFINMSIAPAEAFLEKFKDKAKEKVMGSPCTKYIDDKTKCKQYKKCQWVNGSCTKNKCASYKTMSKCNKSTKYDCTWSPNKRVPARLQKTTGTCKMNVYDQGVGRSYSDPSMSYDQGVGRSYSDPSMSYDQDMGGSYSDPSMSGEGYSSDMAPY